MLSKKQPSSKKLQKLPNKKQKLPKRLLRKPEKLPQKKKRMIKAQETTSCQTRITEGSNNN